MKTIMIDKTREIALKILYKIDNEKAYSNIVLNEMIKQNKKELEDRDVGLISEIVYGTTTWKLTLDEIIKKYSKIKLKKISPWILNILRMGIYQIVFLNKIPKSAAVNESVNLAKRYGHKASSSFVNAILRKVTVKDYEEFFQLKDDIQRISVTNSMPIWIVEELAKELSMEKVEQIAKNSNLRPDLSIRINNLQIADEGEIYKQKDQKEISGQKLKAKISKSDLIRRLEEKNIKVEQGLLKDFLILKNAKNIENMEEFRQGLFTIQDETAGLIPIILNPNKTDVILDACSSPGGKTTYLAEMMENQGKIEAWDIHEHRTKLVENTAKRLGITNIKTKVNDATIYDEKYKEKFDKILLDVPCLGLGVLRRKPDIKWQKSKEDIEEITKTQKQILENCSQYLKNGGELVYSTCSILKQENDNIINEFLNEHKEFYTEKINIKKNNKIQNKDFFEKYITNDNYLQVYQNNETDGFFICKMKKNNKR